jgi:membrane associated rhomboid family serine protease
MIRMEEITKNLIIINVLIFFAVKYFLKNLALDPHFVLIAPGGMWEFPFGSEVFHTFKPYQIITSMFYHGDERHLIFNMMGLYFFGSHVEGLLGPKRYLLLYLLAGIVGGIAQIALTGGACLGASGCINGVLIAFATMLPNVEMYIMFIPVPIKSKYVAMAMVAYGVYSGLTGYDGGVGHWAHIGGALVGFLLIKYWRLSKLR